MDFNSKEKARQEEFSSIWNKKLDKVFDDVAPYYDSANSVASIGMIDHWRKRFVSNIKTRPGYKALDICAGTNVIGIALLKKEPKLQVFGIDKNKEMQRVGKILAQKNNVKINSTIADVHKLPFKNNFFDIVTLQYASRHLKLIEVFKEIKRVLKPGGHFYHCDMLRPQNRLVEQLLFLYLRFSLLFTSLIYKSSPAAHSLRDYFIKAIHLFYSSNELKELLVSIGFTNITYKSKFFGMVAFHKAKKLIN